MEIKLPSNRSSYAGIAVPANLVIFVLEIDAEGRLLNIDFSKNHAHPSRNTSEASLELRGCKESGAEGENKGKTEESRDFRFREDLLLRSVHLQHPARDPVHWGSRRLL